MKQHLPSPPVVLETATSQVPEWHGPHFTSSLVQVQPATQASTRCSYLGCDLLDSNFMQSNEIWERQGQAGGILVSGTQAGMLTISVV
eukprot:544738-Pelagomonas_calceolata.AAC.5